MTACHFSPAAQFYRSGDWQQLANDMQNVFQVNHSTNAAVTRSMHCSADPALVGLFTILLQTDFWFHLSS
jgi:hypothetical protein